MLAKPEAHGADQVTHVLNKEDVRVPQFEGSEGRRDGFGR